MFGRKTRELENEIRNLKYSFDTMRNDYWELRNDHHRLLDHLGLKMVDVPQDRKLVDVEQGRGLGAA